MDKKVKNFIYDVMNLTDKYKGIKIGVNKKDDVIEILITNSDGVCEKLCITTLQIEKLYSLRELLSIVENKIQTIYIS